MIIEFCFVCALVILLITVIKTVNVYNRQKSTAVKPIYVATGGVFAASIMTFIPVYADLFETDSLSAVKTILLSIHNAIRLFIVDGEFDIIRDHVTSNSGIGVWYSLLAAILFVAAPILTFGLILSLLRNMYAHIVLWCAKGRNTYVFSELNDRALALAESIKKEQSNCKIVFTDVYENDTEEHSELAARARGLKAISFRSDIETINFSVRDNRSLSLYLIGKDETENIRQSVNLINKFRERDNTHIYIFSSTIESELLISDIDKGKIKARRINENHALINGYLYEEGEILFDHAAANGDADKEIRAAVVGLDSYGEEMFRTLTWFCQMDGYKFYMSAYDPDPDKESELKAKCPELLDEVHNGKFIPGGEAFYDIKIHSGANVRTEEFAQNILAFKPTFVFVSQGSDRDNIATAVMIRTICERAGLDPDITTICKESIINESLMNIHNFKGQPYRIRFIGSVGDMYSSGSIINKELEEEALRRHCKWGGEEDFWQYEYNYKSSIAVTMHSKVKEHCKIAGALKTQEEMTDKERYELESLEHRRWNAYMRSEGYVYNPVRNDLAHMHHDLVPYDKLKEEEKRKDSKVAASV